MKKINKNKKYCFMYSFDIENIIFDAVVEGLIFEKKNDEIESYKDSDFEPGFERAVGYSVNRNVGENIIFDESKIMETKNNDGSYAILIDENLWAISMKIKIGITTDPFTFFKNKDFFLKKNNKQLNKTYIMGDHKYHRNLEDPQGKKTCIGRYYNFKKGMEYCKHKDECELYKEYVLDKEKRFEWDIHFDLIKYFRQCKIYKHKQD